MTSFVSPEIAAQQAPTLTVGGLPVCVIPQKDEQDVGESRLSHSLDDTVDYFASQGAAARERLARGN